MRSLGYKYGMVKFSTLLCLFAAFFFSSNLFASEIGNNNVQLQQAQSETATESKHVILKSNDIVSFQDKPEDNSGSDSATIIHLNNNPIAKAAIEKSISLFTERIKDKFSLWLSRSGKYLDLMKNILKSKDLPEDIAFLPLIESGFNPAAYSVAKAVGPWQFIASTAKRYGLKIDWWRDERRDPIKSTVAAADYLKDLYDMFGSWNLAMAAYNAGEGKILKALNRTKRDDYWELTSTKYIKKETKEYVPKFVAARMIATNPDEYGFDRIEYHQPFDYDEVTINHPIDLDVAARCADTTVEVIKELNPELRRWSTPPGEGSYSLRIPSGKKESFLKNLSEIPEEELFTIDKYKVKKGDTIKKIASKTGIPISVILELNDGLKTIKQGDIIFLPPMDKYRPDRDDIKKVSFKSSKGIKGKKSPSKSKVTKTTGKNRTNKTNKKKVIVAALEKDHLVD
ncbi:MAG: transglycosylase SLT domain-containing protein [Thermodesulfovibrionales bacterium]